MALDGDEEALVPMTKTFLGPVLTGPKTPRALEVPKNV